MSLLVRDEGDEAIHDGHTVAGQQVFRRPEADPRRLRMQRGWSQVGLDRQSGVSFGTIAGIESGKGGCHMRTAVLLARALDVTVEDIIMCGTV